MEALTADGLDVWFDKSELRGGDAWDRRIREQINTCRLFVPIISAHTEARDEGYFRREWKLAVDRTHDMAENKAFLVPVVIDSTRQRGAAVPERFQEVQWTVLPAGAATPAFVSRISALSGHRTAPVTLDSPAEVRLTQPVRPRRRPAWQWALGIAIACVLAIGLGSGVRNFWRPAGTAVYGANSIAVLPFADMSERHDQEYLADGIAEELLDLLTKTSGLRVMARTSSFSFKGKSATIPEIGRALRVANVLEGSVRRAGDRLRVTTQLIRTDNGEHVWSETYDRDLKDVFAVQDEISAAVVAALKLKLVPATTIQARRTSNPRAYDQYLLGRYSLLLGTQTSNEKARAAFQEAIRLDPTFAPAYGELGFALMNLAIGSPPSATYAEAASRINQALALDPSNPDGFYALTRLRLLTLDFAGALEAGTRARQIAPDSCRSLTVYADALRAYGRLPEAIAVYLQAQALDPLDRVSFSHAGYALIGLGDFAGARAVFERANALAPDSDNALAGLADLALLEHHPEAVAKYTARFDPSNRLYYLAMAAEALSDRAASEAALRELTNCCAADSALAIANIYAYRRDTSRALDWVERAARQRDSDFMTVLADPILQPLRSEPRFKAVLASLRLPD
jgi:adenylate cyclase